MATEQAPARRSTPGISSAIFVDAYDERKKIGTAAERFAKLPPEVQRLGQTRGLGVDVLEVLAQLILTYRAQQVAHRIPGHRFGSEGPSPHSHRTLPSGRCTIGSRLTSTTDINRPVTGAIAVDLGGHGHAQ